MRLRALSLSFLVPTVACAVGPHYKPPKVAVPKAWQEPTASGVPAGDLSLERWWMAFHDPIVDRLVARAVEGNLDLKIAGARIREARAARGIAASAALPQVGVGGAYSRSNAATRFRPSSRHPARAHLSVLGSRTPSRRGSMLPGRSTSSAA